MVIEFAGLPGSGKTTICELVTVPHRTKASIPLTELRVGPAILPVARDLLLLCLSARPLEWARFVHGVNLLAMLRCYARGRRPVVLEQGVLQKIWSMLMDAESYPKRRLQRLMDGLRAFAPQYIIWVETPLEEAAYRVRRRAEGRSRFDRLPPEKILARLTAKARLLDELARQYQQHTSAPLLRLDGQAPAEGNARRIDELLLGNNQAASQRPIYNE
jgi:thymidylate kinase